MASTGTPGITVNATGHRVIDSKHRRIRIYVRLGPVSAEEASRRLSSEIARIEADLEQKANSRARFIDCAARYVAESANKRSVSDIAWHVRLLTPYIGTLDINAVHDGTLQQFIADRFASGLTATTVNRSLSVVRTVLNRAAPRLP